VDTLRELRAGGALPRLITSAERPDARGHEQVVERLAAGLRATVVAFVTADTQVVAVAGDLLDDREWSPDTLVGRSLEVIMSADAWGRLGPRFRAALAGAPQAFGYHGSSGELSFQLIPSVDALGDVTGLLTVVQRTGAEAENAVLQHRLAFEQAPIPMAIVSVEEPDIGTLVDVNAALCDFTGYTTEELLGRSFAVLHDPRDAARDELSMREVAAGRLAPREVERRYVRADGTEAWGLAHCSIVPEPDAVTRRLLFQVRDVTQRRVAEEDRVRREALYRSVVAALDEGIVIVDHTGAVVDVNAAACEMHGVPRERMLADLDWYQRLEPRLEDGTPLTRDNSPGWLAATSGVPLRDVVLLHRNAATGSDRYLSVNFQPVLDPGGTEVKGMVVSTRDVTAAKREEQRSRALVEAHRWAGRLRRALDEDDLVVHAQPIVDLTTGRQVSEELLVRLRDADGAIVAPGVFLPAAEEFGLIAALDERMLRHAVALAASGRHVHVNLSAQSLSDPALQGVVGDLLTTSGASGENLVIELTETAVVQHLDAAATFARRLEALGVALALDDFGTGFGTLTYLKRLPAQILKIDREFVCDLTTNRASRHVVGVVVDLARRLGQRTVGEGVEDEATAEVLRDLGVDLAQGYHFGRPAPLE
jgi:PAS domain S-box-containing protein